MLRTCARDNCLACTACVRDRLYPFQTGRVKSVLSSVWEPGEKEELGAFPTFTPWHTFLPSFYIPWRTNQHVIKAVQYRFLFSINDEGLDTCNYLEEVALNIWQFEWNKNRDFYKFHSHNIKIVTWMLNDIKKKNIPILQLIFTNFCVLWLCVYEPLVGVSFLYGVIIVIIYFVYHRQGFSSISVVLWINCYIL